MPDQMIYDSSKKSKLFDYNTSFLLTRTNPSLSGNVKITLDSSGGVSLNSINANPILSEDRFKNYNITGKNSYPTDLYKFFSEGSIDPDIIFDVSKKTQGDIKTSDSFSGQYDFFYGSGARTLIDKNYSEDFSYFAPLWLKEEIPDFFVIFKTPGPISYPYSSNVSSGDLEIGKTYKVISPDSDLIIDYGVDNLGAPIKYYTNDFIVCSVESGTSYNISSGSGSLSLFEELKFKDSVDDVKSYFTDKILPNSYVIETYDLRSGTLIGDYIRGILNSPYFSNGPIDFNLGENAYTYFNGIDYRNGIYGKSGEFLYDYLKSEESDSIINFDANITDGFRRNGIISSNLINMEFAFSDDTSDLYTINRYFGMYVSRNDLASLRMNGNYYFEYKDAPENTNEPKPIRNNTSYYYNGTSYEVKNPDGVRLYYENAIGWLPGSVDVNESDSFKMYYLTDKNDKFHSLKRINDKDYIDGKKQITSPDLLDLNYGPYDPQNLLFLTEGSSGATSGTLVISDPSIDLLELTGIAYFSGSFQAGKYSEKSRSYIEISFEKPYDLDHALTFKLFWSGGSQKEGSRNFDIIRSGDFSGIFPWFPGDYYNEGESKVFNASDGTTSDIANSLSSLLRSFGNTLWESGISENSSITRIRVPGEESNSNYSVSVFSNYTSFISSYRGAFDSTYLYVEGDITIDTSDNYLKYNGYEWVKYNTFPEEGYGSIMDVNFSDLTRNINFGGGSDYPSSRFAFNLDNSNIINTNSWVKTRLGYGKISKVLGYLDSPTYSDTTGELIGFSDFDSKKIAYLENLSDIPDINKDGKVSVYIPNDMYIGVFTFFDVKEFNFDFWSSDYSITPTEETRRYFSLSENSDNIINNEIYYVKSGSISYGSSNYSTGQIFFGTSAFKSFSDSKPGGKKSVVVPGVFTDIEYAGLTGNYSGSVPSEANLDLFNGFYGLESLDQKNLSPDRDDKMSLFNFSKLNTEYEYLYENYNIETSNISRIVPYINKWALSNGTDSRGNPYRLNVSPVFSPSNFSPFTDKSDSDPLYFTHEWFLLTGLPGQYPVEKINDQKSYLPQSPDYNKLRDVTEANISYFNEFFTVASSDYASPYGNESGETKEMFGNLTFNEASGFYDVVFKGVKYIIKKRSKTQSNQVSSNTSKYIKNYRGFDGYKFNTILEVVDENPLIIQSPVTYEIIENAYQKFVSLLITVVVSDYRAMKLGYQPTDSPVLDYTLLYTLSDKKSRFTIYPGTFSSFTGSPVEIADIKLSSGIDLSFTSDSYVDDVIFPGRIYGSPNPDFDTDLREEVHLIYGKGSTNTSTGTGSFYVPDSSSTYPWAVGVSKSFLEMDLLTASYYFDIPFIGTSGITIPSGSSSFYSNKPVSQIKGGSGYMDFIINRISLGEVSLRINSGNNYIKYNSYSLNILTGEKITKQDSIEIEIGKPSYIRKNSGLYPVEDFTGPQNVGESKPTSYSSGSDRSLRSDILRFSGKYEPIFRKIIKYKNDKTDTISGDNRYDLSFRNATFGPEKEGFGIMKNLPYTKTSIDNDILSETSNIPQGAVYPLVNQTPIARKDYSIFYSNWDPGYYDIYKTAKDSKPVAGTREMKEQKSFFGSKIMQTPDSIRSDTFIGMEVSKIDGISDVDQINSIASDYVSAIQNIDSSNSGTGIGQLPKVFIGTDIEKMDESIFPNAEFIWQKDLDPKIDNSIRGVKGVIRLDRILRRYLLNSGVSREFINNMISEFGVGDPERIEDDIISYIDLNVNPIYKSDSFSLYIKSKGSDFEEANITIRGDILGMDRAKKDFLYDSNFILTKRNDLIYEFNYKLDPSIFYSMTFTFDINKI